MLTGIKEQISEFLNLNNSAFTGKRKPIKDNEIILFLEENGYWVDSNNKRISSFKETIFDNKTEVTIAFDVIEVSRIKNTMGLFGVKIKSFCSFAFESDADNSFVNDPHRFHINIYGEEDIKMSEMIVEFISFFASDGRIQSDITNLFWTRYLNPSKICMSVTIEVIYIEETIKLNLKLPGISSIKTNVKFKTIKDLGPMEAFRQTIIKTFGIHNPFPLF